MSLQFSVQPGIVRLKASGLKALAISDDVQEHQIVSYLKDDEYTLK